MAHFLAGTKRHNVRPKSEAGLLGNSDLSRMYALFSKAQKGTTGAKVAQLAREVEVRNSRTTSL